MANFFKSTFFKCTALLLSLMIVFGGLLAVLNDLLYVPDEVRTARAIKKIYGEDKVYSVVMEEEVVCGDFGSIDKIYLIDGEDETHFDYLFHVIGKEGFQGGTITYWIKVKSADGKLSIDTMKIESNTKQSFIGSVTDTWHALLKGDINSDTDYVTTKSEIKKQNPEMSLIPTTGATNSKNASCYAVNCVVYYVNNFELGGKA